MKRFPNMSMALKKNNGVTLIELLVVLIISSLLIAGLYRTFITGQKVYTVEDQVVDMQQNVRGAINRMVRDIKMAGFGNVSMILPATFGGKTFNNVLNPNTPVNGSITIVSGSEGPTTITGAANFGQNQITVSTLTDNQGNPLFDLGNRKYISIGGIESYVITSIAGKTITLNGTLLFNHPVGTSVFGIRATTYQIGVENGAPTLERDDNTGAGNQPQADSIENLQFGYFDANGNPTADPATIRMVRVALTARTNMPDPDLKGGDNYRRRQVASNIHLENMDLGF
jgi:prepilin-type N-terminal cleavage/methylation domain-containing protein